MRGKCKYCAIVLSAHSKLNGTSSLRNHMLHCTKHPHSKDIRQALLTLKPKSNVEADDAQTLGILGTWKFDQDAIRNALVEMCITDELPFKIVEREGFKKLMSVACPRFTIPSRFTVFRDIHAMYMTELGKLMHFL